MHEADSPPPHQPLGTPDDLRNSARKSRNTLKGRQATAEALEQVRALIGPRPADGHRRDLLIEHLHTLNDHYRALFERHLVALAQEMKLPMAEVFEVASFYHHFEVLKDDANAPALTIRVCDGLACEMAGAQGILARLPALLGNPDIRVVAAPCLGRCERAPVATVHQSPVTMATEQVLASLAQIYVSNQPLAPVHIAQPATYFIASDFVEKSISPAPAPQQPTPAFTDYATYRAHGGYGLAAAVVQGEYDPLQVIAAMEDSGLRGLGGAGFPAGRKWRIVREQSAPRVMAVNIDEGEPGTFKDRTYLERDPHRFLEGMLIAAQVVGTEACYLYLRDEYHGCRAMLQAELAKLQADPPCPLPAIELRRGA